MEKENKNYVLLPRRDKSFLGWDKKEYEEWWDDEIGDFVEDEE